MKNLAHIVAQVQNDWQDYSDATRLRYMQFAINSYKEDVMFKNPLGVEVVYLTPNEAGIINMPCDLETWTKVGLYVNNTVFGLTYNKDLPVNINWDKCGDIVINHDPADTVTTGEGQWMSTPSTWGFVSHWRGGQYVGEMYGARGGINTTGYFTADYKNRVFQINSVPQTPVCIEYLSNNVGSGTIVEDAAINMLRYGVHRQIAMFDSSINQADKQRIDILYKEAKIDYKHFKTVPSMDQYLDDLWSDMYSSPKR